MTKTMLGMTAEELHREVERHIATRAAGDASPFTTQAYYDAGDRLLAIGDALCRKLTAASDLDDLIGDRHSSYVPTLRNDGPDGAFAMILADIYDFTCAARCLDRKAWRGSLAKRSTVTAAAVTEAR